MLSGGEEGVLVIWQLETGTKQFIPRLQSNILSISLSHDGNTYALSMGDNRIKFVSAVSNRVEKVVVGLSYSAPSAHASAGQMVLHTAGGGAPGTPLSGADAPATVRSVRIPPHDPSRQLFIPFLYSPLHGGWYLNSILHPGALQLYDLFADRHLMDADLLQRNVLSKTDGPSDGGGSDTSSSAAANAHQPRIEQMVLHPRGHKMATLERRSGQASSGVPGVAGSSGSNNDSTILKFWDWHAGSSSWRLNTRVEPPHSHATAHQALVGLLWHPKDNLVVSIGRDHCFKIWREIKKPAAPNVRKEALAKSKKKSKDAMQDVHDEEDEEEEECYWNCTGVGHYRSYPTSGGAFSSDGSLLAVAYGQVLTLWDPYTLTLKHTLLHPSPALPVRFVSFVPGTPFLVSTTARAIFVWNLLTLALWWSFDLRVIALAVDGHNAQQRGAFAAMVLQPDEDEPEEEEEDKEEQEDQNKGAEAKAPAPEKPFRRRQTHLLLFSVHSPVPLRAWPLRDARLETVRLPGSSSASSSALSAGGYATGASSSFSSPILFANDPALLKAQGKQLHQSRSTTTPQLGSAGAGVVPTSLIYINYKRQLVRLDDIYNEGAPQTGLDSLAAASSSSALATAQSEEISLFEQLYGKGHRAVQQRAPSLPAPSSSSSATPAASSSSLTAGGSSSSSSLGALLNAPSHILPPPSSLFTAVMDTILARSGAQVAQAAQEEHQAARDRALQAAHAQAALLEAQDARMAQDGNEAAQIEAEEELGATTAALHANIHAVDASLLLADTLGSAASGADGEGASKDGLFCWDAHPDLGPAFGALVDQIKSAATEGDDKKKKEPVHLPVVELSADSFFASEAKESTGSDKKSKKISKKDKHEPAVSAAAAADSKSSSAARSHKSKSKSAASAAEEADAPAPMDMDEDEPAPAPVATSKKSKKQSSKSKQ
jgi:WD40 repeat protein